MMFNPAKLPLWALRLCHTQRNPTFDTVWPASPEEGLLQSLALWDLGHLHWLASFRQEHSDKSGQEVEQLAYDSAITWHDVRNRLTFHTSS